MWLKKYFSKTLKKYLPELCMLYCFFDVTLFIACLSLQKTKGQSVPSILRFGSQDLLGSN